MTYPSHDYDGLETPSSDPFDDFLYDDNGNTMLEDDVNDCVEDDDFDDIDLV